jgi:hypothetical protein
MDGASIFLAALVSIVIGIFLISIGLFSWIGRIAFRLHTPHPDHHHSRA